METTQLLTPENLRPWTLPQCYAGAQWDGYYGSGFGRSRDSSDLEESNFQTILNGLAKLPAWIALEAEDGEDEPVSRYIVRESHWAVGWVEWIAIHPSDIEALKYCDAQAAQYKNYPALDESDLSERETESANQVWRDCYRPNERVEYIRKNRSQFDFNSFADLLGCVRGRYFAGYASELLS